MTAHTPGPWRVTRYAGTHVIRQDTKGQFDDWIARTWGGENTANARLIAAAPDLLEALQGIASLRGTEENEWDGVERLIPQMCDIAIAAIAKATGETA